MLFRSEDDKNTKAPGTIDLQFLPEGGYLSYGCACKLAFIAHGYDNEPIGVSGWILNGSDEQVVPFATSHEGMGTLTFIPEKDMNYKAVIDNCPGDTIKLPVATDKVQLSVNTLNDSVIAIFLLDYEIPVSPDKYYLINSSGGKIGFFVNIEMTGIQKLIKLSKDKFESGINKLTLADSQMRPVAERLIFVKKNDPVSILAKTDRDEYNSRKKVKDRKSVV